MYVHHEAQGLTKSQNLRLTCTSRFALVMSLHTVEEMRRKVWLKVKTCASLQHSVFLERKLYQVISTGAQWRVVKSSATFDHSRSNVAPLTLIIQAQLSPLEGFSKYTTEATGAKFDSPKSQPLTFYIYTYIHVQAQHWYIYMCVYRTCANPLCSGVLELFWTI